jgi:hypothetical protein
MNRQIDLDRLSDFFSPEDIEWKPMRVAADGGRALAAAYVTNRAIMDRLDEVCGRGNWRNEFKPGPDGGVICGLSIRIDSEWVTKWDGAENTDIEPVKGGLSSSMRRAAVQWGIGRYLYRLPSQWVDVDKRGHFLEEPRMEPAFLPTTPGTGDGAAVPSARPAVAVRATPEPVRPEQPPVEPSHEEPARPRSLRPTGPANTEKRAASKAPAQKAPTQKTPAQKAPAPQEWQRQAPAPPTVSEPKSTFKPKKRIRSDADQYFMPKDLPF